MGTYTVSFPLITIITPGTRRNPAAPFYPNSEGWFGDNEGSSDADLLPGFDTWNQLQGDPPAPTKDLELEWQFDQNTVCFSLDGGPLISYNSLPPGFLATSVLFSASATISADCDPAISWVRLVIGDYDSGQQLLVSDVIDLASGGAFSANDFLILRLNFTAKVKFNSIVNPVGFATPGASTAGAFLEGEYNSVSQEWTLETPTDPVQSGDTITVTSPTINGIDFTAVDSVTITYPDGTTLDVPSGNWTTIEAHLFEFTIPSFGGDEPTVITISITSTEFSGSVILGSLITIYFTSASGLYRLIPNQRHDELYIEDDPGETIDVKIPNPSFRTGFIGG